MTTSHGKIPLLKILQPLLIIALATLVALAMFWSRPEPEQAELKPRTLLLEATRAVKEDIRIRVRAQGTVTPKTQTLLMAEVSGRIISVSDAFQVGGFLNKGEELLRIDQRDYIANVKRAEAAVASARSELASEKGRAEVAYQDWVKYRSSVKRSQAAEDLALRKPQQEDAEAKLASALADLDHARDQLDRTIIRAPYDGLVKSKEVDIGQYVNLGSVLAETFSVATAELRLALPDNKLNYLELPTLAEREMNIEPRVDIYAEIGGRLQHWQGRIVRTEGIFDERSRVLFAIAEIDDPYNLRGSNNPDDVTGTTRAELRMGTFVDASIEGRLINDLVVLPRHLLGAGNKLWVINPQQQLQSRSVSILRTEGENIYVTSGLEAGELVSLSTIADAAQGSTVNLASVIPSSEFHKPDTLNSPNTPDSPAIENNEQPILELAPISPPAPDTTPDDTMEGEVSPQTLESSLGPAPVGTVSKAPGQAA